MRLIPNNFAVGEGGVSGFTGNGDNLVASQDLLDSVCLHSVHTHLEIPLSIDSVYHV
jgi:hypothetical protein